MGGQEQQLAIATFALVGATAILAGATAWLGWQAREQVAATRAAETAQRRDAHISAAAPILMKDPPTVQRTVSGPSLAYITIKPLVAPTLKLSVQIRGVREEGGDSVSHDFGSLPAGGEPKAALPLDGFLNEGRTATLGPGLEVVLSHFGILGQWVVEHYEWLYLDPGPRVRWRLYRLEIAPLGVPGATSIDQRFGEPPAFA